MLVLHAIVSSNEMGSAKFAAVDYLLSTDFFTK
jgi:hypothetical protein